MILTGSGHGFGALSVQYYVNTYSVLGAQKYDSEIALGQIMSFPLKFIVTTITWIAGVVTLHLATHSHVHLGVECLRIIIFY